MSRFVGKRLEEDKDRICYMYSMLWLSTEEIARNIGYSSSSSVKRALRRWGVLRSKAEQLDDLRISNTGREWSEETKKHVAEGVKRSYATNPELRKQRSLSNKASWASMSDEEKKNRYINGLRKMQLRAQQVNVSSIETKVKSQFDDIGIRYIHQLQVNEGKFVLDFYIPSLKLVIECNGDYWHNLENRKRRDDDLKKYVMSTGRSIIFIWEHEINDELFWVGDYIFGGD